MENFLYKCELCSTARFSVWDQGEAWFIDCGSCRTLQFHHKVVIVSKASLCEIGQFYCEKDKEVEDDRSKEKV